VTTSRWHPPAFSYQDAGHGLAVTGFLSWRRDVDAATARIFEV